jgi:hypothetical protein
MIKRVSVLGVEDDGSQIGYLSVKMQVREDE